VVVVFDVTNSESYGNVKRWLHEIETNCENVHKVLVVNKVDDPERRVISAGDARRFADSLHINYFETSAKENINVEQVSLLSLAISCPGSDSSHNSDVQLRDRACSRCEAQISTDGRAQCREPARRRR